MADPLTIFATSLALLTTVVQSSNAFLEITGSVKSAPAEILSISQDVKAFQAVVLSLQTILEDGEIATQIAEDRVLLNVIQTMDSPLRSCSSLVSQLIVKTRDRTTPDTNGTGIRIVAKNLEWGLFTRHEVTRLRGLLSDSKSTLNSARGAVTM